MKGIQRGRRQNWKKVSIYRPRSGSAAVIEDPKRRQGLAIEVSIHESCKKATARTDLHGYHTHKDQTIRFYSTLEDPAFKMGVPTPPTISSSTSQRDVSDPEGKVVGETGTEEDSRNSSLIDPRKELYDSSGIDPVLARKMTLVNNAIDEIGMTPFQWKLFFLNGFGYAVDSVSKDEQSFLVPTNK